MNKDASSGVLLSVVVILLLMTIAVSLFTVLKNEPKPPVISDTCATCKNYIDTVKEREMMMYINGDFIFRNEVHKAYEKRLKSMKCKK